MTNNNTVILEMVNSVLRSEGDTILALPQLMDQQQSALQAVIQHILKNCGGNTHGRLILSGVGKAGIIAHKISATFASTGTPSLFMHCTEAQQGDLGMVQACDTVLALSNSGSSDELIAILPPIKRIGASIIALSGNSQSPLVKHADLALDIGKITESCPLGMAPSNSTTALLALGDALALSIQRLRDFQPEDYARYHPGGALGRKMMCCHEIMRDLNRIVCIEPQFTVQDALQKITKARCGSAIITNSDMQLLGIFTDGDLRRALGCSENANDANKVLQAQVSDYATMPCAAINGDELLQAALHICNEKKINELPVCDSDKKVIGMMDLQDLTDRGYL